MPGGLHNPFPASLHSECKKACKILQAFINPTIPNSTNKNALRHAQGLVILTALKFGFLGSVRFGSGLIVARLDDGSWSAPSAIGTGGLGAGGQFGLELTNFIFILRDKASVKTFSQIGSLTLGANISMALGPVGRNGEVSLGANSKGFGSMLTVAMTNGLFGGISLEGGMLIEGRLANKKFYGRKATASQLLDGEIAPPPDAEPLMQLLASEPFHPRQSHHVSDPEQPIQSPPNEAAIEEPAEAQNQPPSERLSREAPRQETELHGETSAELPEVIQVESPAVTPINPDQELSAEVGKQVPHSTANEAGGLETQHNSDANAIRQKNEMVQSTESPGTQIHA